MTSKNARRAAAVAVALLATTARAQAHVTLAPGTISSGATATFTVRCPDERSAAATVKLVLQIPAAAAFRSVIVPPVGGWASRVTYRGRAVDTVTWTGGAIQPGRVGRFTIVAGPVSAGPRTLLFPAVQTYDDGEVVRWIDRRGPGEPEPPFPAPAVHVR